MCKSAIVNIQIYSTLLSQYPINWQTWQEDIKTFLDLLEQWNDVVGLVSKTDLSEKCIHHIEDSLSLVPYILPKLIDGEGFWLDIGTGSGFPAIPILLISKQIKAILVERKIRKVGFLQMLISKFQLNNTKVICNEFPACVKELASIEKQIRIVTSKGVEHPERLAKFLSHWLSEDTYYLCQSPKVLGLFHSGQFVKTIIQDEFSQHNLRRGNLTIIHRKP
mgnify:CR=1 FL=1